MGDPRPDPAPAPTARRRRLAPEARRAELLDRAAEIVGDRGIQALTMEGLAARSGVNKSLPYYYFGSRDGVLVALADREFRRLADAVVAAADRAVTFPGKLRNVLEVFVERADARDVLAVLDSARSKTGALEAARLGHTIEAALFFGGLLTESYDLEPNDALAITGALLGAVQGLVPTMRLSGWSTSRTVDVYVALFIGAIEAGVEALTKPDPQTS